MAPPPLKTQSDSLRKLAGNSPSPTPPCKICGEKTQLFDVVDFNKFCNERPPYLFGLSGIPVYYSICTVCNFIFTTFMDNWSAVEFSEHIYNGEYIRVDGEYASTRPIRVAQNFSRDFAHLPPGTKILDYGSGSGGFSEILNKTGKFKTQEYDPFSKPERPKDQFRIVTCQEVVEHSTNPLQIFSDMMSFLDENGVILFSTSVQPENIDELRCQWWYIAPRNGHVSIYSRKCLVKLAALLSAKYYVDDTRQAIARNRSHIAGISDKFRQINYHFLTSPATDNENWHAIEHQPKPCRWTNSNVMTWRTKNEVGKIRLIVEIPFENEAATGTAEQTVVKFNGIRAQTRIVKLPGGSSILAESDVNGGDIEVVANIPQFRPSDNGGRDTRWLGLFIPIESPAV